MYIPMFFFSNHYTFCSRCISFPFRLGKDYKNPFGNKTFFRRSDIQLIKNVDRELPYPVLFPFFLVVGFLNFF